MSVSEITAIVTAFVAVAGLLFSIYNFYVARRDKRDHLKARISAGFLASGPDLSETMLLLEVANPTERRAIISSVGVDLGRNTAFFPWGIDGTRNVPFELPPGENAKFWTPMSRFASSLRKEGLSGMVSIRASFADGVGARCLSTPMEIDVNDCVQD